MSVIDKDLMETLLDLSWDIRAIESEALLSIIKKIIAKCRNDDELTKSIEHLWSILTKDEEADLLVTSSKEDYYVYSIQELWEWIDRTLNPKSLKLESLKQKIEEH